MISRRALIAGVVSSLSVSSFAHGQQPRRIPRIGVLWHAANIEEETPYFQSLIEGFQNRMSISRYIVVAVVRCP
jgi:hypothetical protein